MGSGLGGGWTVANDEHIDNNQEPSSFSMNSERAVAWEPYPYPELYRSSGIH